MYAVALSLQMSCTRFEQLTQTNIYETHYNTISKKHIHIVFEFATQSCSREPLKTTNVSLETGFQLVRQSQIDITVSRAYIQFCESVKRNFLVFDKTETRKYM